MAAVSVGQGTLRVRAERGRQEQARQSQLPGRGREAGTGQSVPGGLGRRRQRHSAVKSSRIP